VTNANVLLLPRRGRSQTEARRAGPSVRCRRPGRIRAASALNRFTKLGAVVIALRDRPSHGAVRTLPFGTATRTTAILVRGAHNSALGYLCCPSGNWLSAPRTSIMRSSVRNPSPCKHQASQHSTPWPRLAGDRKRPQDLGLSQIPEGARSSSPGSLESNPWRRLTISKHREHLLPDTEDVPCRGAAIVEPNAGMRQRIYRRA
jgi:hypothetical protein